MENYKNGYQKYSEIFKSIEKECNNETFVREVRVHGNISSRSNKEDRSNHYLLNNGLHVYINDESVIVSNNELQKYRWAKDKDNAEIYMKMDKEEKQCQLYMEKNSIFVGEIIYNLEPKDVGDYSYLPSDFKSKDFEAQQQYEVFGEVSDDMGDVLKQATQRAESPETQAIYNDAIQLETRMVQVRDKEKKKQKIMQIRAAQQEGRELDEMLKENKREEK